MEERLPLGLRVSLSFGEETLGHFLEEQGLVSRKPPKHFFFLPKDSLEVTEVWEDSGKTGTHQPGMEQESL